MVRGIKVLPAGIYCTLECGVDTRPRAADLVFFSPTSSAARRIVQPLFSSSSSSSSLEIRDAVVVSPLSPRTQNVNKTRSTRCYHSEEAERRGEGEGKQIGTGERERERERMKTGGGGEMLGQRILRGKKNLLSLSLSLAFSGWLMQ